MSIESRELTIEDRARLDGAWVEFIDRVLTAEDRRLTRKEKLGVVALVAGMFAIAGLVIFALFGPIVLLMWKFAFWMFN